jgi:predicted O-linked N-acetylglucosamine transferase (SPINDLY family)
LLRAVGLPELITKSFEEYHAMALRLARNGDLLAAWRARLEANRKRCPLFDAGQFARNLEQAYIDMWQIHASGEKPRAFAVSPG